MKKKKENYTLQKSMLRFIVAYILLTNLLATVSTLCMLPKEKIKIPENTAQKPLSKYATISAKYLSFYTWRKECKDLPLRARCTSKRKKIPRPVNFSKSEIKSVAKLCLETITQSDFNTDQSWLGNKRLPQSYFDVEQSLEISRKEPLSPRANLFVQKIILPSNAKIGVIPDIHGSIHALNAYIKNCIDKHLLDEQLRIINKRFYLVSLGDYSDRGTYGSEALYLIMRLKLENPTRCFTLRGNHESFLQNLAFTDKDAEMYDLNVHILKEGIQQTYGISIDEILQKHNISLEIVIKSKTLLQLLSIENPYVEKNSAILEVLERVFFLLHMKETHSLQLELQKKVNFSDNDYKKLIITLYDLMPSALFVGIKNQKNKIDYLLFCHGGFEPRYNPRKLLADKRELVYEHIQELSTCWLAEKKITMHSFLPALCKDINSLTGKKETLHTTLKQYLPYVPNPKAEQSGFVWIDFIITTKNDIQKSTRGSGHANYNRSMTKSLLHKCKNFTNDYSIKALIRGHQHHGPMLKKLIETGGIYNVWSPMITQWDGIEKYVYFHDEYPVWTLNMPAGASTAIDKAYNLNYGTYIIIKVADAYKDWRIQPIMIKIIEDSSKKE